MPSIDDLPPPPGAKQSRSIDDLPPPPGAAGPTEGQSALRSAIGGYTAGLDDEFTGALGAAGRVAGVKNLGSWKPFEADSKLEFDTPTISPKEIIQAYRDNRDAIRDEQRVDAETNPKATLAGSFAGSIISPASKIKIAGKGGQLGQAMKTAAAQGAVFSAGMSDSDLTKGEVGKFAKDVGTGAAIGAAVPPALKGAGAVSGWAGRKVFNATFGTNDIAVQKYWKSAERIRGAKTLEQIKDFTDDAVGEMRDAVEQGKLTEAEAKGALQSLKEQVTTSLKDKNVDAKSALRIAEDSFSQAKERVLAPLKSKSAPTDRAAEVAGMVGELKSKVQSGSQAARELLSGSADEVDLSRVYGKIDEEIDRLRTHGTKQSDSVIAELQDYKKRLLTENWAKIKASDAKPKIQGLDAMTDYSPLGAGAFDEAKNKAYKGIRNEFDASLKDAVPAYRKSMVDVAGNSKLLEKANDAFGRPEVGVGKLGRITTPRGEFDRTTLVELENAIGKPGAVTKEVDQFAQAQRILKDPQALRQIEQSLPEYQTLRQAMVDVYKRNPKWTRQQIEQATAKQRNSLAEAVGKRVFAEKELKPLKRLGPDSSESKIKTVMAASLKKNPDAIETRRLFDQLGDKTGKNVTQMIEDRAVLDAFEKGNTNGSRNTLFWGALGFFMGGPGGAAGGAAIGNQVIDKYGPRVGKAILDGMLKVKNNPSVKTIRSLNLPDGVKRELEQEFRIYTNGGSARPLPKVAEDGKEADRSPSRQNFASGGEVKTVGQIIGYPGSDTKPVKKDEKKYAKGGPIPGEAKVSGNSEKNDTVPAMLSPGEIVLPRSVTMAKNAPEAAAKFVAEHLKKSSRGPEAWALKGAEKLGLSAETTDQLMQSKEGKRLLIEASDLAPGSRAMQKIKDQIQKGLRK